MTRFHAKDEVAVMPRGSVSAADVIHIARVAHVGRAFVQTHDHRVYTIMDGFDVDHRNGRYIVPATEQHRAALLAKVR